MSEAWMIDAGMGGIERLSKMQPINPEPVNFYTLKPILMVN
jgi:hypothetical protein